MKSHICRCDFNGLFKIDLSLKYLKDELPLDILLYGSVKYRETANMETLLHTTSFPNHEVINLLGSTRE